MHEYSFLIPKVRNTNKAVHADETWGWFHAQLEILSGGYTRDKNATEGCWVDNNGNLIWDDSSRYVVALEENKRTQLFNILANACKVFDQHCIYVAGGPNNQTWLIYADHQQPTDSLQEWVTAQLAAIENTKSRPAKREAEIVIELKDRCTEAGLFEFALTLPEKKLKTPRDCRLQLMRCLRELELVH